MPGTSGLLDTPIPMVLSSSAPSLLCGLNAGPRMRSRNQLNSAIWLFAFLVSSATSLFAASVKTPRVEAEIVSRYAAVQPGHAIEAALRLKIIDHWHTYWRNPGDSGLPTKITWSLPEGFTAGPIEWPYPKKLPLGPLMNFGYDGEVLHLVTLQTPLALKSGQTVTLNAKAEWLVCSDVCIPESADLAISLPVVGSRPLLDARWVQAFTDARAALPGTLRGWTTQARIENNQGIVLLTPPAGEIISATDLSFYPLKYEVIANAGKQILTKTADGLRLTIPLADPVKPSLTTLDGVLVSNQNWGKAHAGKAVALATAVTYAKTTTTLVGVVGTKGSAAPVVNSITQADDLGLGLALLFAFIGGLISNLMPCVFPVLGIKVMSFVGHAQGEQKRLRQQGFAFLGGVVISFWILAGLLIVFRAAGESIGWGFQLQSPVFVTLLAILFLLMALNLSGVFEFGMRLQTAAGNIQSQHVRSNLLDAFLSGVLATIIATPCLAPFMGAALGFTLAQPAHVSLLVFTAVALGMAAPILLLSMFPAWLRYLPKPGMWMDTFKQFMAFPLFATVAWLAWVLGSQQGNDGVGMLLFGMVIIALGAWLYGCWQPGRPVRALVAAIALLLLGAAIAWPAAAPDRVTGAGGGDTARTADAWIPFSKQKVSELRGQGRAVFIDFTATWCITCQVNKRIALSRQDVLKRFDDLNIVRMRADWTVKDPAITEALAEFGRNGVPLYVFYPANGEPRLLPEVLTPTIVLTALGAPSGATALK